MLYLSSRDTGSATNLKHQLGPRFIDLAIYDDVLPSPASPFRNLEYQHYLTFFGRSALFSFAGWHHGFAHSGFGDLRATLNMPAAVTDKIFPFEEECEVLPRLAYVTFLANAIRLLPYFKARNIPFVLQLYPGGRFEPHVPESDRRLAEVVNSPLCRRVIATQNLTQQHLLGPIGCDPAKVELIYGGVFDSQVGFDFARDKKRFGIHKDTVDLCFVAHRYSDNLAQKGYDNFVEVARLLAPIVPQLNFHVVGDYTADDLPLGEVASRFIFYGRRSSEFFADFYPRMDAILSANEPAVRQAGAFDGFPTGACMEAGFRGVLNCIADPLSLNVAFEDGCNIMLVDRDPARTAARLAELFAAPQRLYALAEANWRRFGEVFDINNQLWRRTGLLVAELLAAEQLVLRPVAPRSAIEESGIKEALAARDRALAASEYNEHRHDALLDAYRTLAAGFEQLKITNESMVESRANLRGRFAARGQALLASLRGGPRE